MRSGVLIHLDSLTVAGAVPELSVELTHRLPVSSPGRRSLGHL